MQDEKQEIYVPEIAVDLDGTLAQYNGWEGEDVIGEPIQPMLERVKKWMAEGKKVTIFTARADCIRSSDFVYKWLDKHGLTQCEVTNIKRKQFIQIWDDRAIRVMHNTGCASDQADFIDHVEERVKTSCDIINNPLGDQVGGDHYKKFAIQPIEYVHKNKIPAIEASIIKYITRHKFKGKLQDLEKARHLIDILIDLDY